MFMVFLFFDPNLQGKMYIQLGLQSIRAEVLGPSQLF